MKEEYLGEVVGQQVDSAVNGVSAGELKITCSYNTHECTSYISSSDITFVCC